MQIQVRDVCGCVSTRTTLVVNELDFLATNNKRQRRQTDGMRKCHADLERTTQSSRRRRHFQKKTPISWFIALWRVVYQ